MTLAGERVVSPEDWVRDQTEKILDTGTTEGVTILDRPVVLVTIRGAKSGKLRYTPLMRVEHDGRYALVASKGGAPEHPKWYRNLVVGQLLLEHLRGLNLQWPAADFDVDEQRRRLLDEQPVT